MEVGRKEKRTSSYFQVLKQGLAKKLIFFCFNLGFVVVVVVVAIFLSCSSNSSFIFSPVEIIGDYIATHIIKMCRLFPLFETLE